jgi:hypothetical protein
VLKKREPLSNYGEGGEVSTVEEKGERKEREVRGYADP